MSDSGKAKSAGRGGGGGFGSRIPKINFGFRKQTKEGTSSSSLAGSGNDNGNCSERSTPEGCEGSPPPTRATGTKSGSSSNNSSPTVGRSKSLRLPRSTYLKYTVQTSHSNMDSVRDEAEDFYPDDLVDSGSSGDGSSGLPEPQSSRRMVNKTGQTGLTKSTGRPRSSTVSASTVSHLRSRSISPGGGLTMNVATMNGSRELERTKFGFYGGSLSQTDTGNEEYEDSTNTNSSNNFSRRSQSFSAKHQTRIRAGSFGAHNRLQPPQAGPNQPFRRSKTPTYSSQRTSLTGQTGSRNGSSKLSLSRTSSLGKVKQQSVSATAITSVREDNNSSSQPSVQTRSQISRSSSGDVRGKRPSSVVIADGTADLNTIAQELSQGDVSQPEVKSVAGRMRPSSAKKLSASSVNSRRSHSSIGYSKTTYHGMETPERRQSPPSSSAMTSSPSTGRSKHLSAVGRVGSIDKQNRPMSARDCYQHGRKNSLGGGGELQINANMEGQLERSHSAANFGTDDVLGSAHAHLQRKSSGGGRSSAPSSGRSTPIHRSVSATRLGKDATDGGVVSVAGKAGAGLPPRTPYRSTRTKTTPTSTPAGINELEGSVLLEADDYRRISNDVKSLKTALLKLKRELQADLEGKTPSSQSAQTPRPAATTPVKVGRSVTTPATTASLDLRKKLKTVTSERDKALEEVGSCKKELKSKSKKIESLMAELEKEKKKNEELSSELEQVEGQRNRLLDKVERLHADKHNLEARLNTLERASIYEQTFSESWLDEVDGDGEDFDIMDPALGADGGGKTRLRKEMTESEIGDLIQSDGGEGESSEPESAAVCSAPILS